MVHDFLLNQNALSLPRDTTVQASRVRFRFEADALEVVLGENESKSENKFVGGENRWKYDAFTNWEVRVPLPRKSLFSDTGHS